MNHGKKLAVVVAYDMYLECAEGSLTLNWKVDKPVGFHRFREKLALQMLRYNPADNIYPGDENCRAFTKLPKQKRCKKPRLNSTASLPASSILQSSKKRLCGDLGQLNSHIALIQRLQKSGWLCGYCGEKCYQVCGICNTALHYHAPLDGMKVPCFFLYHDVGACGLARDDCQTMGTPKRKFKVADERSVESNRKSMKRMISSNNSASTMAGSGQGNNCDEADNVDPNCVL